MEVAKIRNRPYCFHKESTFVDVFLLDVLRIFFCQAFRMYNSVYKLV